MEKMPMKKHTTLMAGLLMLGAVGQSQAADFAGTLNLQNTTAYVIQYEFPAGSGTYINALGALDVDRYDLGNALSGSYNILFTPGSFNSTTAIVGFMLSDNPNQAIVDNPGLLGPAASNMSLLSGILQGNWWAVYHVPPNSTDDLFAYNPTLQLTAGTNYYLFASGGSVSPVSIPYTLSVTAAPAPVPVPPALWLFGSGLLGLIGVARRKTHRDASTA